jgi:hypothetical protein
VILACESLKTAGSKVALAGRAGKQEQRPLAVKADFLLADMQKLAAADERETMNGQTDGETALIAQECL